MNACLVPSRRTNPFGLQFIRGPLFETFDDVLNEIFGKSSRIRDITKSKAEYPKTDILETTDGKLIFKMAVPGLAANDLNVEIEKNTLTISSDKKESTESEEEITHYRRELKHSSFCRSWTLPEELLDITETTPVKTSLKNGILVIEIPLVTKEEETKKISIEIVEE